jgi:NADH dehydrogenase
VNLRKVLLLGGSGFVGRHLAIELAQRGYQVTLPCRRPHRLKELTVLAGISLKQANIIDPLELNTLSQGHDIVINLVGILNESGKNSFRKIHVDFAKAVVNACQNNKVRRLLHMSALSANQASGSSNYLRTKGEGENLVHTFGQKDLQVTSFQPSVIFGAEDSFINRFAGILRLCKGFFPLACPQSRFAPVYIGDVVSFMANTIEDSSSHGQRYPLCGPETYSLKQILQLIDKAQDSDCKIIGLPDSLAKLQAMILQILPGKLFTMDNYRSLQTPSTCNAKISTCPTSLSHYVSGLPSLYNKNSDYNLYRQHSRR